MGSAIYNREPQMGLVADFRQTEKDIEDLKTTQIVGNDNLMVYYITDGTYPTVENVPANSSAHFMATFTFDDPPVNSYVELNFEWYDINGVSYTYTEQRYDDPATMGDQTKQSAHVVFSPDTTLSVAVNIYCKSTSQGTLTLTRIS